MTLTPDTVAATPRGTRFERCRFAAGDYRIADATILGSTVATRARLSLVGQGTLAHSVVHGQAWLGGESFSHDNLYLGRVQLDDHSVSRRDHFTLGYVAPDGASPTVELETATFGPLASPPEDDDYDDPLPVAVTQAVAPDRSAEFKRGLVTVAVNTALQMVFGKRS